MGAEYDALIDDTSTRSETDERVNQVYKWRLNGVISRRDILQLASKLEWGLSDRAVDEYIRRAKVMAKETAKTEREAEFHQAYLRLQDLYARAMSGGDLRLAQSVQRDISELFNLYEININLKTTKTDFEIFLETVDKQGLDKMLKSATSENPQGE